MRKVILLGLAAICALICSELIVSHIINFPTYGVEMKMTGIRGLVRPVNIFKPFSEYWNVEGGNKVFRRNNIGLPGIDIQVSINSKYVFVLGSSFIEAYQLPPDKIATSIFQIKLQAHDPHFQVLNLGISGHDPYDLYWRANFYKIKYPPVKIVLVIDSTFDTWFKRHRHPLSFEQKLIIPRRLYSSKMKYASYIVNQSSFFNLVSKLTKKSDSDENEGNEQVPPELPSKEESYSDLIACISNFKRKYQDGFFLISINRDTSSNEKLYDYCMLNDICYISKNILLPEYRLNVKGHLNIGGNKLLGEMLYDSFVQSEKI